MSAPVTRILRRAAGEIGYSRWTDPNRGTKYARETQPALWPRDTWLLANGISFCDIFITWVFWKEGLLGILPAGASYNTDYRSSHGGRISKSQAEPGDVLVFDWNWGTRATNHVGILEKTTSHGNPQTIEGNTSSGSSGSQSNGGGVYRRVRRWSQVRYVIRPRWHEAIGIPSGGASVGGSRQDPWESSPRVQGMSIGEVKTVQRALVDAGYSVGSHGIDGSYKADTYTAVKAAQKALGVAVDGIAGPDTMNALTGAQKPAPKPAAKPAVKDGKLVVDGRWGEATTRALQKRLGVAQDGRAGAETWKALQRLLGAPYVDGVISRQSYKATELGNGIVPKWWKHTGRGSKGSQTIKLLQKRVGVKADGVAYEGTTRALQKALNDGKF